MTHTSFVRSFALRSSFTFAAGLGLMLLAAPTRAQTPTPTPAAGQAPEASEATAESPAGESYRVEFSAGLFASMPSRVNYSDTETITPTGSTTSATIDGTNIDFKHVLGLANQRFSEFHLVVQPVPKFKLRGDFIPLYYKQSATLASDINYNGRTYLAGKAVTSTLHWNAWQFNAEYDVITTGRGFIGGMAGVSYFNVSAAMADDTQSGTAGVNIPMPGLGAIARYYPTPRVSLTGVVNAYYLPGGTDSTHGHVVSVDGSAIINVSKYFGIQGGYRFFNTAHTFGSPLNTGAFTIGGPYLAGVVRY